MTSLARNGMCRFGRRLVGKRYALAFFRLIQVLAVLFTIQLSGLAHRIADSLFHEDCAGSCEHHSGSGNDDDDSDCPPGCPSCHSCMHAQSPYVPRPPRIAFAPLDAVASHDVHESRFPPQPDLPSIFHPPRV